MRDRMSDIICRTSKLNVNKLLWNDYGERPFSACSQTSWRNWRRGLE